MGFAREVYSMMLLALIVRIFHHATRQYDYEKDGSSAATRIRSILEPESLVG